ncbi:MAG TPA: tetratricopeptide repeat protein, partial [Candidatus Xenobia bacterium]
MKRKRKKQARVSDRPPEWANMLEALEAAVEQEPDNPEVVRALLQCYATGGDVEGALGLSERLIKLAPEDSYGYMVLAEIQLGLNYPGLTRHTLTRIPRPDSECTRRLRDVEAYLVGHRRYRGQPEPVELAKQFDTFLWQFRIAPEEVAADTARDLAARWPGAVYAHCDIAHTLWGRQEEVAVTLLLRLFQDHPTHPAVLSTLADAHTTAGRRAEAQALAKTLKDLGPLDLEDEVARAVTLSRLGDDQGVLDAFDAVPPPRVPALLHFAAAAACRLGRREHARRWWEEVLRQDCSEVPAAENLDDLKRAPAEREGPFAFRLSELWGQKRYERLVSVLDGPPWETEAQVREFIVAHPELPLLVTDALH